MDEPCRADCASQRYPPFPYDAGAESLLAKALPIMLSAIVVVISWLAGRFIDKIQVTAPGVPRVKSGNFGTLKRCASDDKSAGFHSSARDAGASGGTIIAGVQELEGISVADDEGRLYNETYGSERSQNDGDRYDALGDSPGAQGPCSQGPRSPSVYSHFSQSVFSQSAYGPSAYGPSQRRPSMPGSSQIGSSGYLGSSVDGSGGGSLYPGSVPSQFGASQTSEGHVFGGGIYGNSHAGGGGAPFTGGMGRGVGVGGGGGRLGGGSGGSSIAAPPYNPNAMPVSAMGRGLGGGVGHRPAGLGMGVGVPLGGSGGGRIGGGSGAGLGMAYGSSNRGSPPPYSQANMLTPASVLQREDPRVSLEANQQAGMPHIAPEHDPGRLGWGPAAGSGVGGNSRFRDMPDGTATLTGGIHVANVKPKLDVVPQIRTGPRSGFGSDSDGGVATPSTFRA